MHKANLGFLNIHKDAHSDSPGKSIDGRPLTILKLKINQKIIETTDNV